MHLQVQVQVRVRTTALTRPTISIQDLVSKRGIICLRELQSRCFLTKSGHEGLLLQACKIFTSVF